MIVKSYVVISFTEGDMRDDGTYKIEVPKGARLVTVRTIFTGVQAWYEINPFETEPQIDTFKALKNGESIPSKAKFVEIVEVNVKVPNHDETAKEKEQEMLLIFPLYKLA